MLQFISNLKNSNYSVFESKLNKIASQLGVNPDWLMAVFMIESGCNPQAVNSVSGATGLIQFMPSTATNLGTTTSKLRAMTGEQQLDYVYAYLKPYAGKMNNIFDCYFAVFFPSAIGKSDSYILQTSKLSASTIAKQNKIYDLNNDNKITRGEVVTYLSNWLKKKTLWIP